MPEIWPSQNHHLLTYLAYPINAHASFVVRARRPIFDLLDIAKKKSKSSAMQYSLQMSSSR